MTQSQRILIYLGFGNSLTPRKALTMFGTMRLSARIYDLRREGHKIRSKLVKVRTRSGYAHVAAYYL